MLLVFPLSLSASTVNTSSTLPPPTAGISQLLQMPYPSLATSEQELVKDWLRSRIQPHQRADGYYQLAHGGWTGGGGGGGIACFPADLDRNQIFDREGRLSRHARSKITNIYFMDFILGSTLSNRSVIRSGESWHPFLQRKIAENLRPFAPEFTRRLEQALSLIVNANGSLPWEDRGALKRLNDYDMDWSHLTSMTEFRQNGESPENCFSLQMAMRFAQRSFGQMPHVFIDYDQDLFEKMGRLNTRFGPAHQAALVLHEALYLMGVELGMTSSESIPSLVTHILKDKSEILDAAWLPITQILINMNGFGDYDRLFQEEGDISIAKARRRQAWDRIIQRESEIWRRRIEEGTVRKETPRHELSNEERLQIASELMRASNTDEEVFLSFYLFRAEDIGPFDRYPRILVSTPDFERYCEMLRQTNMQSPQNEILRASVRYCDVNTDTSR